MSYPTNSTESPNNRTQTSPIRDQGQYRPDQPTSIQSSMLNLTLKVPIDASPTGIRMFFKGRKEVKTALSRIGLPWRLENDALVPVVQPDWSPGGMRAFLIGYVQILMSMITTDNLRTEGAPTPAAADTTTAVQPEDLMKELESLRELTKKQDDELHEKRLELEQVVAEKDQEIRSLRSRLEDINNISAEIIGPSLKRKRGPAFEHTPS